MIRGPGHGRQGFGVGVVLVHLGRGARADDAYAATDEHLAPLDALAPLARTRLFVARVRHLQDDGGGVNAYLDYFTLPGNGIETSNTSGTERYYDFKMGSVQLFALDSDSNEPDGISPTSVQGQWLQ